MAKGRINILRGKVLIDHGKVQTCRCCEKWGTYCQYYHDAEDRTPKYIAITITDAGELSCSVINPSSPGDYSKHILSPDIGPNGTYILEQITDCTWIGLFSTEYEITTYSDDECSIYSGTNNGNVLAIEVSMYDAELPNVREVFVDAQYSYEQAGPYGIRSYMKSSSYYDGLDDIEDIELGNSDSPLYWNRYTGGSAFVQAVL